MNIQEVEKRTGLEASTIRYYEDKGLLDVKRNPDNNYREYSNENVDTLRVIRFLRKLDFTLSEIESVINERVSFKDVAEGKLTYLNQEVDRLEGSIALLESIKDARVSKYGISTETIQSQVYNFKTKTTWIDKVNDFSDKVSKFLRIPRTAFVPEDLIFTKYDFTVELIAYAYREGKDLEIIEEGLEPLIKVNGKTYRAMRAHGAQFGNHYVIVMPQ